jgi:hypothetical protein
MSANGSKELLKSKALVCTAVGQPFDLQELYIDQSELDENQAIVEFKASGIW